jgi:hypothetical protein
MNSNFIIQIEIPKEFKFQPFAPVYEKTLKEYNEKDLFLQLDQTTKEASFIHIESSDLTNPMQIFGTGPFEKPILFKIEGFE